MKLQLDATKSILLWRMILQLVYWHWIPDKSSSCRYMECVDLGQAFEDHMVAAINRLTAPKSEWPGFKEALRHQVARQKVGYT